MAQRQFYMDEDFPTHPKTVQAGGDAGWLHVCALAWASKHMTGKIPKSGVPQLSDRRKPMELAEKLVKVGLWHDRGDHYELHDWEVRNKKRLAARRKAKRAADERWRKAKLDDGSEDATSMPVALLQACSTDALEPTNQRTNEPTRICELNPSLLLKLVSENALEEEGAA